MLWIQHPVVLETDRVKLLPLEANHFTELLEISKDADIWQHLPVDGADSNALLCELKSAVLKRTTREQYPFVILDKRSGRLIGSTRLLNIFPEHKKLEIGWTWYKPEYWGTGYNTECKLLLMTFCFEILNTVRVQFQTREQNQRSRAAIQKIGAQFEGLLRNERIGLNGAVRNTAVFSVINDEWDSVKLKLTEMIKS